MSYLGPDAGYRPGPGNADLYKFFCQRYRELLREEGRLGVVLPRSGFLAKGSADFRHWLFEEAAPERLDFLLNNRLWMFDTHPAVDRCAACRQAAATHRRRFFRGRGGGGVSC